MADKTYMLKKSAEDVDATLNFALRYDIEQSLTAPERARVLASLGIDASKLNFEILGYFDSFEELEAAITAPEPGDAYGVGMSYPYDIYIWDNLRGRWVNNGPIRGADGEDGKDAELTAEGIVEALGYVPADADEPISFERLEKNAKTIAFENITVPDWAWEEVGASQQYPWRAAIELPGSGVDASWEPSIVFDDESLLAAELAPRCESFENGVFIFAAAVPESLLLIKTLSLTHSVIEAYASSVFASIFVTYAAGATLTATDGTTTLTAKSTSGKWTFAIPYAGSWAISDGENERIVNITTQGQAVSVVLDTWNDAFIIADGEVSPDNPLELYAGVATTTTTDGVLRCVCTETQNVNYYTKEKIDVTNYSALIVEVAGGKAYYPVYFGFATEKTQRTSETDNDFTHFATIPLSSSSPTIAAKQYSISLADVEGEYYFGFSLGYASGMNDGTYGKAGIDFANIRLNKGA